MVLGGVAMFVVFFAILMHGVYRQWRLLQELGIDYARPSTWTAEYIWKSVLLGIPHLVAFPVFAICALLLFF
jgi:hypothetical protein